jgi:SlyX protein
MEERLVDLETRLAFQDQALEHLTAAVLDQGQALRELRAEVERLRRLLMQLAPSQVGERSEEPPPHY